MLYYGKGNNDHRLYAEINHTLIELGIIFMVMYDSRKK